MAVILTAREIVYARKAGNRLARRLGGEESPSVTALCRNACLLAAALRRGDGSPVYPGGEAVLTALTPEELLEACETLLTGSPHKNPAFDESRFSALAAGNMADALQEETLP